MKLKKTYFYAFSFIKICQTNSSLKLSNQLQVMEFKVVLPKLGMMNNHHSNLFFVFANFFKKIVGCNGSPKNYVIHALGKVLISSN
jgi:hypothetical protein